MFGAFSSFLEDTAKQLSTASEGLMQNISTTLDTTLGTSAAKKGPQDHDSGSEVDEGHPSSSSHHSIIEQLNSPLLFEPPSVLEKYAAEWSIMVRGLLEDENTFSLPVAVVLQHPESMAKLEAVQFSVTMADLDALQETAQRVSAAPHEALIAAVVGSEEAQKTRFDLVPRMVSETAYWSALLVRVALLRQCQSLDQLLDVMEILNREPRRESGPRKKGFGTLDNVVLLQNIRDQVLAKRTVTLWVDQRLQAARSEIHSTLGSLQLLRNLVIKQEVSELADSVRESCKYRKGKVTAILAEMQNSAATVVGTPLEPEKGEVFVELVNLNEELHQAIVDYTDMRAKQESGGSPASASPTITDAPSLAVAGASFGAAAAASATAAGGSAVATPGTNSTRTDDSNGFVKVSHPETDAEFTADLPWDDDEE